MGTEGRRPQPAGPVGPQVLAVRNARNAALQSSEQQSPEPPWLFKGSLWAPCRGYTEGTKVKQRGCTGACSKQEMAGGTLLVAAVEVGSGS